VDQVTAVFVVLDTVALNCWVPPDETVAEIGEMETATAAGAAVIETVALADFEGSTLVAVTVAVVLAVTVGAV